VCDSLDGIRRFTPEKTLAGLQDFYANHANVHPLIFAILVEKGVELDALKWESDYSFTKRATQVWARIFRNVVLD
jgi:hypothetical protein